MSPTVKHLRNLSKFVTASLAGFLLVACETMGPQDTDQFIFLDESEPLFVEFDLTMNPALEMSMPDVADNMKDLRRRDYMQVMQELVYLYRFPIDVHILGENEDAGNGPVLDLFAIRFEQERTGEIVVTLQARLHRYGELNTLGTYTERQVPPISLNERQMDEAFREALRAPLREMLDDLMLHFPTEEDREMVEAPLRELE